MGGPGVPTEHPGGNGSAVINKGNADGHASTLDVSPVKSTPERRGIIVSGANDGTENIQKTLIDRLKEIFS